MQCNHATYTALTAEAEQTEHCPCNQALARQLAFLSFKNKVFPLQVEDFFARFLMYDGPQLRLLRSGLQAIGVLYKYDAFQSYMVNRGFGSRINFLDFSICSQ